MINISEINYEEFIKIVKPKILEKNTGATNSLHSTLMYHFLEEGISREDSVKEIPRLSEILVLLDKDIAEWNKQNLTARINFIDHEVKKLLKIR